MNKEKFVIKTEGQEFVINATHGKLKEKLEYKFLELRGLEDGKVMFINNNRTSLIFTPTGVYSESKYELVE